jgi:hypothetical protein
MRKMIITGIAGLAAASALAGCATLEEGAAELVAETHHATLTGAEVVSSAGDSDGYARADLTVSQELGQICYDVNDIRNLGPITSLTINRAPRGQVGPAILRVSKANEGGWKNCVGKSDWLEQSFEYQPGRYYIQISTTEYPNGAIRGQFRND